jgi:hypothetical protein
VAQAFEAADYSSHSPYLLLNTGTVNQGITAIAATSIFMICTAETIHASTVTLVGVARRGSGFSPIPGSQE